MSSDERILDAAVRVFADVGFRAATTRKIAQEAGVNEVTLFRRFGSKERLAFAVLQRQSREKPLTPLPLAPVDAEAELTVWAREHIAHLFDHRAMLRAGLSEIGEHPDLCASTNAPPVRVAHELAAYLDRLREVGLAHGDWDARVACSLLMGAIFADAISRDAIPPRHPYPLEEAAVHYVRLFLGAIGATRSLGTSP